MKEGNIKHTKAYLDYLDKGITKIKEQLEEAPPKDGYTPIKGTDYFTQEEVEQIKKEIAANIHIPAPQIIEKKISKKITDKEKEGIIKETLDRIDISVELPTAIDVRNMIESLKGDARLDASKLKNMPGGVIVRQGGGSSGGGTWGSITGTLSDQTDLQAALDAKQDDITATLPITLTGNDIGFDSSATFPIYDNRYLQRLENLADLNNVATARTNLGLVAGGTGDIWVEKAGDTMSGDLVFSGAQKIIGGTGTTSDLTFQVTSGIGATGADMHFLVGNNGATEPMTILNSGNITLRATTKLGLSSDSALGSGFVGIDFSDNAFKLVPRSTNGHYLNMSTNGSLKMIGSGGANASIFGHASRGQIVFSQTGPITINLADEATPAITVLSSPSGYTGFGTVLPDYRIHVQDTTDTGSTIAQRRASGNAFGPYQFFEKARGNLSSLSAVLANDMLGGPLFKYYNGASWVTGSSISGYMETTSTTGLAFFTAAVSALTDAKMTLTNAGRLGVGASTAPAGYLHVFAATDDQAAIFRANASQSVNIVEGQNSSGTALFKITKDGYIKYNFDGTEISSAYQFEIKNSSSQLYFNAGTLNILRSDNAGFTITSTTGGNKSWQFTTSDSTVDGDNAWSKLGSTTELDTKGFIMRGTQASAGATSVNGRPLYLATTRWTGSAQSLEGYALRGYRNSSAVGDHYLAFESGTVSTRTTQIAFLEAGGAVFNEQGNDSDFRIESDNYDAFLVDASNDATIIMNNVSGKVAFFGATPVTKQTELTDELTTITFSNPGTPDYAIQNLVAATGYGFVTSDEAQTVLSVIANLQTRVNELETKLTAYGLLIDAD